MDYIGRFAPSPTGPLHYGSLVAALASYLDAKHANGKWLLRIEDLDPPRESRSAPDEILTQLSAFGLKWDEEVLFQSTRQGAYRTILEQLNDLGATYACACSRKSTPNIYPGTCRDLGILPVKQAHAIRVRVPDVTASTIDQHLGLQSWSLATEVGDFIIRRKDGLVAYQLAVVVDDIFQSITHIVRGIDLLDSTPRQLALYQLLGITPPRYLHIPILVDRTGVKLSKQSRAKPVPTGSPEMTLRLALGDLGQNTQDHCHNASQILTNAVNCWDRSRIPDHREILADSNFLSD